MTIDTAGLESHVTATEAGTIAALAVAACKVDVHTEIIRDGYGGEIGRRVYGRGPDGELTLVDIVPVVEDQRAEAERDPAVKSGTIRVNTPGSLVDYADRHLDLETATLWGDVEAARLTVILNDHASEPGWADHRAVVELKPSTEWHAWTSRNDKGMSQEELAEFLEEHLVDVTAPDGSTLLEVARTFQATTGATFRRAQSLHSGQVQLTWQEETTAKAGGAGQVEVPREFTLRLRPFVGTEPVEVRGMFRYRVSSGQLQLGYRLLNLTEVKQAAVESVLNFVANELDLIPLQGTAPTPRRRQP